MASTQKIPPINLRSFFLRESITFIRNLKTKITQKKGILGDEAPANKTRTIANKGKDHWLVDTGETRSNAFDKRATRNGFIINLVEDRHSGRRTVTSKKRGRRIVKSKNPPTYAEIIQWIGQDKRYSGILLDFAPGSNFTKRLAKHTNRHFTKHAIRGLKTKVKLNA